MAFACIICTEDLAQDDKNVPVSIKPCGHCFHEVCLKNWLEKSSSCPICRDLTLDSPAYIGKLHFQRLSLDNSNSSSIITLMEQNAALEKQLKSQSETFKGDTKRKDLLWKKKEDEYKKQIDVHKRKEEMWKGKEQFYKEKARETQFFINNIGEDLKQIESIRSKISAYTHAMVLKCSPSFEAASSSSSTSTVRATASRPPLTRGSSVASIVPSVKTSTLRTARTVTTRTRTAANAASNVSTASTVSKRS